MAKVVTNQGTETFAADKSVPLAQKLAEVDQPQETPKPEVVEDGLEQEDKDLPERAAKRIAKKHREMKEAQEAAAEADRFAENQFNEAKANAKRAAELEAQLADLKAQTAPKEPAKEPALAPLEKDFYDEKGQFKTDEYIKAVTKHAADQARAQIKAELEQEAQRAARAAQEAAFKARIDAAVKKQPDWQEVVSGSTVTLPNPVLDYIGRSDTGTDLAYYLAKNPEVAETIRGLPAILAIAKARDIERDLFAKPAEAIATSKPVHPGAPAPITPLPNQGTTVTQTDPAKMTYKELRAYERSRRR